MKCRKLLAILLALVMVIGLLPFAALAEEVPGSSPGDEVSDKIVADQNDPLPDGDPLGTDPEGEPQDEPLPEGDPLGTDPEGEPQDEPLPEGDPLGEQPPEVSLLNDGHHAEWIQLTSSNYNLTEGNYYLSENLNFNKIVSVSGNVTICLNGCSMSGGSDYVIEVTSGTLTICDCKETGAVTSTNTNANAVISVGEGNTLNIEAGTISGGQRGVSAAEGATVNVSGGSIACAASSKQGALRLYSANAYITGGTITGNVWMMTTSTVRLSGTPSIDKIRLSLTEGKAGRLYAAIGSTPYAGNQIPVECTSTTVQPETPIIYDVTDANKNLFKLTAPEGMVVKFKNGNLVFGEPESEPGHSHEGDDSSVIWTELTAQDRELTSGHYYLGNDITVSKTTDHISITGDVTLCLNSHALTSTVAQTSFIYVENGGSLTLCDCGNGGKVESLCGSSRRVIFVRKGGSCTIESGMISGIGIDDKLNGQTIKVDSGGFLTLNGGTVTGSTGIYNQGTTTVSGGTVACDKYGIHVGGNLGVVNMESGSVSATGTGSDKVSGIYMNYGSLVMTGGTVSGTTYGIELQTAVDNKSFVISGGTITGGYGIYFNSEKCKSPLYLTGDPTLSTLHLSKPTTLIFASKGGSPYSGDEITVSLGSGDREDAVIISGISKNADKFTYAGEDFELAEDGKGNLILQTPTTAPEHEDHGADGTDTDPQTWQSWNPQTTPTIPQSGYYYLGEDFEFINQKITINTDVHLCLNGHKLQSNITELIEVTSSGSLTICDCSKEESGQLYFNSSSAGKYAVSSKGSVTLYSGTISSTGAGGVGMPYGATGTFTMEGGTIEVGGTGVFCGGKTSSVVINKGTVRYGDIAGVLLAEQGYVTIAGGTIEPQLGNATGYGLSANNYNSTVVISGGSLQGKYGASILSTGKVYLVGDPEISGTSADLYIKNANVLCASKETASYVGEDLTLSFGGSADETAPIVLDVNAQNEAKFQLTAPEGKILVLDGNNLVLGDKTPDHQNHGADGTETDPQTWQPWTQATDLSSITSGYYYLTANITHDDMVIIESGADVHICLNGQTMTQRVLYVGNNASVTICDCKDNGEIIGGSTGALMLNGGSTVDFYSGTISSEATDAVNITLVTAEAPATFNMYDGTINSKKMGISNSGGIVNVYGGTIFFDHYAGVFNGNDRSVATIAGGTIQPQEDAARGDNGVYVSEGTLYLTGDAEISGLKGDIKINNPNAVYASEEDAAYSGDLLNIYFSGAAAETDPIILNVTSENAALFELVRPYGKDLVRKGNNLYLADKLPPMPELTVTVASTPLTYGQTAQATVSGAPSGVDVTYTYSIVNGDGIATINAQTGEITATGIGTFQVKVIASADGYTDGEATSAEITVNKATPTSEAPTAKTDLVYTGTAQALVTAGTATGGTMVYSLNGQDYDDAVPTGTKAGDYTVWYKVKGDDNHSDTDPQSISVSIGKANLTVKADDKRIYEGSPAPTYTASYSGFVNGQTEAVLSGKLTFTCSYTQNSKPGTYPITPSGLTSDNYAITFQNGTLTVVAVGEILPPVAKDLTYTGKAQKLIDPAQAADDVDLFYSLDLQHFYRTIPEATNAGTYTVYWEAEKDGTTVDNGSLTVTIKKAPLTVTADDTWVYAGDTPAFTATITGYVNGEDWHVLKGELIFTCGYSQKYSKPGSRYTITPKGLAADNYDITFKTGTLTVKDPLSPRFNVYVLDSKHGTVEADCRYARKGDVVTLTIKPDWGYELETLTVTDSHGYELKLTYHSNGTYTFTMPRDNVTVKAIFTVRDMPFVDVPGDAWYAGGVRYVYAHGLMNGTGNWRFSPNRTTTRAMIATILYRMEGSPRVYGTSQFTDVKAGSWYEDAVIWATQNDIVEGYTSKTFGPNDPITREQMAAMLYRYADYCRCDMSAGRYVDLSKYSDMNEISDYAIPALRWAVGEEIIEGRTGKRLAPTDTATRAEVAVMLMRFCEDVIW